MSWNRLLRRMGAHMGLIVLAQVALAPPSGALAADAVPAPAPAPAASVPTVDAGLAVVATGPEGEITGAQLEAAVEVLVPSNDRVVFWGSKDAVERFARSLAAQQVLAARAERAGLQPTDPAATGLQRQQALLKAYMEQQGQATMPDAAALDRYARSEYLAHPERFTEPAEVHVRHILLAVNKDGSDDAEVKARADKLLAELRGGADFAALAQAQSADKGSAQRGGELPRFGPGKMVKEFEAAAFALKQPGELSEPVKSQFGYHIIELLDAKPARKLPFEEALPAIREQVRAQMNAQERGRLWAEAQTEVKIDGAALEALMYRHITTFKR